MLRIKVLELEIITDKDAHDYTGQISRPRLLNSTERLPTFLRFFHDFLLPLVMSFNYATKSSMDIYIFFLLLLLKALNNLSPRKKKECTGYSINVGKTALKKKI